MSPTATPQLSVSDLKAELKALELSVFVDDKEDLDKREDELIKAIKELQANIEKLMAKLLEMTRLVEYEIAKKCNEGLDFAVQGYYNTVKRNDKERANLLDMLEKTFTFVLNRINDLWKLIIG